MQYFSRKCAQALAYVKKMLYLCRLYCVYILDKMQEVIEYIIQFLLYGNEKRGGLVGYTADESKWSNYRVVVVPNGHMGRQIVLPTEDNLALRCEKQGNTYVVYTDVIYNTFFYISRAEELLVSERDEYGRFLAKHSMLGQKNRLMIPLIDEYSRAMLKMLDLALPEPGYSRVYLTHDVDSIAHYRHLRGAVGGVLRGYFKQVLAAKRDIHHDPAYTFSWLVAQDKKVDGAHCIYFVKDTPGKGKDYPQYNLEGADFAGLKRQLEDSGAQLGWHSSCYSLEGPSRRLIALAPNSLTLHRSHYLNCSIEKMQQLVDMGVKDDFTMMFADQAGFRLQTTRAVRWINPNTWRLTDLTLHPLTVMDCTLSHEHYMGLSEDEAYFECQRLFEKVYQNAGELVLLWHNTSVNQQGYHRSLYEKLIEMLS
jgi:hypothetical protein